MTPPSLVLIDHETFHLGPRALQGIKRNDPPSLVLIDLETFHLGSRALQGIKRNDPPYSSSN